MGLSKSKPPRSSPPLSLFRCSIVSYSLLPKSFTRSPIASPLIVAPLIPVSSSSSSLGTFMANFMTSFFCCGTPVFWPIIASLCSMEIMWIEELGVLRHSFSCWLGRFLCRIGYIFFVEIMNQNTVLNEKEVLTKYGDSGKHVYRKCLGCFEGLPLASIIAGRVYLGSLEELSTARRSVLDPPWEGLNLIPGDVLWSDPSMSPGLSPNKERGIGLLWGPDCTDEFLKKFNLKLIIRSHEGPDAREKRSDLAAGMDEGYTIDHVVDSGKLITLFGAPDYPQFQATRRYKNTGAYIVLELPHFDSPVFHSFEAITSRPKANPYYDIEDVIASDEELDLESMVPSS